MLVLMFRLLIVATFIVIVYSIIRYTVHPERKLAKAHENKQFYLLDDEKNVRKNFQLTYKGTLFEGEKYLASTSKSFAVVRIYMKANKDDLQGLRHEDFRFIEEEIRLHYPEATVEWNTPIKEFLKN